MGDVTDTTTAVDRLHGTLAMLDRCPDVYTASTTIRYLTDFQLTVLRYDLRAVLNEHAELCGAANMANLWQRRALKAEAENKQLQRGQRARG